MKKIKLFVEGGGDSKEQHARCREGFRKLLEKSGFSGKLPRVFAGGGRNTTFDQFKTAFHNSSPEDYPILLVDSEEIFSNLAFTSWQHLKTHDHWDLPQGVEDDQAQLMVTCMETWIMADRVALQGYFGPNLHQDQLFSSFDLEQRHRHAVQDALEVATRHCRKSYQKGKRSFEILAELDPQTLKNYLPHFNTLLEVLEKHL